METSRYLIVGGGLTADAACKGIRELDPDGAIVLVGEEPHPPYARPPLSKALWKGDDESTIWRGTDELGVELRLGRRIVALDLERREARDDRGETLRLREAAARDRRPAAAASVRRRRGDLLPHARRLPPPARARRRRRPLRRDRRRLHRLRDRGRARAQRLPGDDGLPGGRDRRAHLPGRRFGGAQRLLPRARRRGARRARR